MSALFIFSNIDTACVLDMQRSRYTLTYILTTPLTWDISWLLNFIVKPSGIFKYMQAAM